MSSGPGRDTATHNGQVCHTATGPVLSSSLGRGGGIPLPEPSVLYDMVSTCNRQLAILRRIRDRRRRTGEAAARNIDFDIRNLEGIQRLLVAMERGSYTGCTRGRDNLEPPLLPGMGLRRTSAWARRARPPTPWLPGFGG